MPIIIKTDRLILRPLQDDDLRSYTEIMTQHAVTRLLGNGQDKSKEDVANILKRFQYIQQYHEIILHGIVEKNTKRLIGHCGYLPLPDKNGYELLYALEPNAWGKGYASEAAYATIDYTKKHYDWSQIYAMVYPENIASRSVLSKMGFIHEANKVQNGINIELLRLKLR